jgi:hypothetical protein
MPIARIIVTSVSDEGDQVIVWGRPEHGNQPNDPVGFAFQAKGDQADVGLPERASRLRSGQEAVIEYTPIVDGWNLATGLSAS